MNVEEDVVSSLTDLARQSVMPLSTEKMAQGLGAVTARLADRRRQRQRRIRSCLGAGALAALLVAGWKLAPHLWQPPALSYQVQGGQIVEGGYLRATDGAALKVRFTEGSQLDFPAGTRGRLRTVDQHGASVALEQGTVDVMVVHRPKAHWLVEAGPFQIHVLGTSFSVAWDSASEALDLRMRQGLVSVSGPLAEGAITVRGGQRLAVSLPGKKVVLQDMTAGSPEVVAPESPGQTRLVPVLPPATPAPEAKSARPEPPSAPAEAPTAAPVPPRVRAPASQPALNWAAALAAGDWYSILHETERRGLRSTLATGSSEDLAALADAARYGRRDDIARQALLAQRQRFPGSPRAHEAAFQLGRLDEGAQGGERTALTWYEAYLAEAPSGALASEALGRKMGATRKLLGDQAARAVAEDYLRRFPNGTYAGAARALRQAP